MCGPLQSQPGHAQAAPPLKLRPEETRLLLECGIATLVSPSTLNCVPPQEKLKAFDQFNRRLHEVSVCNIVIISIYAIKCGLDQILSTLCELKQTSHW